MPKILEGDLVGRGDAIAIVVARWNELVTARLLEGALDTLRRHGVKDDVVTVARVPGSFELPLVADQLAKSGKYKAVICLGAVIQGETTHHEYINQSVAASLQRTAAETGKPVLFGVLTCQSLDQALDRAGGKAGNKGADAALAALEMIDLLKKI
jgi:6,7-dimethyl-8-ribityllumazine synthase